MSNKQLLNNDYLHIDMSYWRFLKFTGVHIAKLIKSLFYLSTQRLAKRINIDHKYLFIQNFHKNPLDISFYQPQVIPDSITDYIGNTPLIQFKNFHNRSDVFVYGKCEFFNPSLSIKDRIVISMLRFYENNGSLKKGATIYEASSGNTGSSLAMIGKKLGYKIVITVPFKTSKEKITTMEVFGAKVIISNKDIPIDSPEHYVNKAKILSEQDPSGFYFDQYGNQENVMSHYRTTASEIWNQTYGKIDYLICPASSGGTLTGVAKFLKEKNKNIKIILPDPIGSVFYDFFHGNLLNPESYSVEGAGKDTVTEIIDFNLVDEVIKFSDQEAYLAMKKLAETEGVFVGGSSGGALAVAEKLIQNLPKNKHHHLAVMLPDSGFKYLSKLSQNQI